MSGMEKLGGSEGGGGRGPRSARGAGRMDVRVSRVEDLPSGSLMLPAPPPPPLGPAGDQPYAPR